MKEMAQDQSSIKRNALPLYFWVSIFLYLLCLVFPGFYVTPAHEPMMAYEILMSGWLGVMELMFAWFANPVYLFAIIAIHRPGWSFLLSIVALLLALSFLHDERIMVNAVPAYQKISGYGWGFCLWVLSITVLTVGQLLRVIDSEMSPEMKVLVHLVFCGMVVYLFVDHHYLSHGSHYYSQKERSLVFNKHCKMAEEKIYKKLDLRRSSIFIPEDSAPVFKKKRWKWENAYYNSIGLLANRNALIAFYETKNTQGNKIEQSLYPYLSVKSSSSKIRIIEIESEYSLVVEKFEFPRKLNLLGGVARIAHMESGEVLASSYFIFDGKNGKFCGKSENGSYSIAEFLVRALES